MAKQRNDSLDIAKGIGILLVVLGHTMSPVMEGHTIIQWLYKFIYTFHMPLFFFVSGYVAQKLVTKPVGKSELLKGRLLRLMIPYLVWAIIYLPMKFVMAEHVRFKSEYTWYSFLLGNNPDGQLWFLYVVFIISVFMIFCVNKNNLTVFTILFMIASFFAPLIPYSIGFTSITLNFSLYQTGFFFMGTLLALKGDYQKFSQNNIAFIISIIVVAIYAFLLFITKSDIWYLKAVVAAFAIYACIYISTKLCKTKAKKPLSYLGKKSMEIYILHGPILVIGRIVMTKIIPVTGVYIIALSVVAIGLSIIIALTVNKLKIARLLLFGSK